MPPGAQPRFGSTKRIGVGMQKGGVGKTTNALHIAAALAERGRRVLLWDVDENYGATKILGLSSKKCWTTMDVVEGRCAAAEAVIGRADSAPESSLLPKGTRFDAIPSSRALQGLDRNRGGTTRATACLEPHVSQLCELDVYDYIILDTGPHASATTRAAYLSCDYYILSVTPEMQAIGSLPDALRDVMNARKPGRNPDLTLLGLVLCDVDRRMGLAKEYERKLDLGFVDKNGRKVKFKTTIGTAAAIGRAYRENQLLLGYERHHRVAQQFRDLAAEVESRIARLERARLDNARGEPRYG